MERDRNLQNLLKMKVNQELSDSLEDSIMASISKEIKQSTSKQKSLSLAWFFFLLGLVLGISISSFVVSNEYNGFAFYGDGLVIRILCFLVILALFEKLYRLTIETRNK